jgi:hypothetical protein
VKHFRAAGYTVLATHICNGQDFFTMETPNCDYIISNPPYSLKGDVIDRLFEIGKPSFSSVYICSKMLPRTIVFEEIDK